MSYVQTPFTFKNLNSNDNSVETEYGLLLDVDTYCNMLLTCSHWICTVNKNKQQKINKYNNKVHFDQNINKIK